MKKLTKPQQLGPVVSSIQVDHLGIRVLRVPTTAAHPDGIMREVKIAWTALDGSNKTINSNQVAIATDEHAVAILNALASDPFAIAETFVQQGLEATPSPPASPQGTPSA